MWSSIMPGLPTHLVHELNDGTVAALTYIPEDICVTAVGLSSDVEVGVSFSFCSSWSDPSISSAGTSSSQVSCSSAFSCVLYLMQKQTNIYHFL